MSHARVLLVLLALASCGSRLARSATYDVGPGRPLATLRAVPWAALQPGDVVNVHAQPGGYHEKIQISASGTAAAHVVIRGIPDPVTGALPVIDGKDAVEDPSIDWRNPVFSDLGVIVVSPRRTGYVYGVDHVSFVDIESLDIRNALYTEDGSITYTDQTGAIRGYDTFACGIYVEWAHDLTVRGCEISSCGNGLFANSKNGAAQSTERLLVERNWFHDNSMPRLTDPNDPTRVINNGYHDHHSYTEGVGVVYQYNRFGPLRPGAHGTAIKDRSSGQVIRYNEFDMDGESNVLALLDPQGGSGLIDAQPDYLDSYVYGNVITVRGYASGVSMIMWGAFNGPSFYAAQHRGTLHFYGNTVTCHHEAMALFFMPDRTYSGASPTLESIDCRNNVFFADDALQANVYDALHFTTGGTTNGGGDVVLGPNWISPGWRKCAPFHDYTGALVGAGNLLTGDLAGANDPGFTSLSALDYRPVAGSRLVDAGGALDPSALPAHDLLEEYVFPLGHRPRVIAGAAIDLGALEAGCSGEDADADGILFSCDGCRMFADPLQDDADADGITDACDWSWGDVAPAGAPNGTLDVADVVRALRFAVALDAPSPQEFDRANVAPATSASGLTTPALAAPRVIDVADVVLLLRGSVGLVTFSAAR